MSLIHKIGLTLIDTVGDVHARSLLEYFGSAEAVFGASQSQLMDVPGIGKIISGEIIRSNALKQAEAQLKFIEKQEIRVLFYTDDVYPYRLRNCFDAPVLLYYRGNADLNHKRMLSVVGTRKATEYGKQLCRQLCGILSAYDVLIVSGLAYGIDVAAHKESIGNGIPTVGVLAHGLDRIYPPPHLSVAQKMMLNGGLLTEFPLNTRPEKENFPRRNRIIAGLSDATIVVEATAKGGALITADIANSYNRDVYAFPGRVNDGSSEGCNLLIRTNRAGLISNADDLLYALGWDEIGSGKAPAVLQLPADLSAEERQILEIVRIAAMGFDELTARSEIPQSRLAMHLLNLEMRGMLISLPGKMYELNAVVF